MAAGAGPGAGGCARPDARLAGRGAARGDRAAARRTCREHASGCSTRCGAGRPTLRRRGDFAPRSAAGGRSSALEPLFPRTTRRDRQPHPPRRVRAARRRARRRRSRPRRDADRSPSAPTARAAALALAAAERLPAGVRRDRPPPERGDRLRRRRLRRAARRSPAHERCVAIGETGLDYYRDYAPREDQQRAFEAQIELARETGKPLVIHTRAADDDTLRVLDDHAGGRQGDPALLLDGEPDRRLPRAPDWWFSFAGNVTYPKARTCARRRCASRLSGCWSRPTPRTSSPQPVRGKPNQPANVVAHRPGARARAPSRLRRARARRSRARRRRVRMVSARSRASGARPELPRRSQHPRRDRAARGAVRRRRRARDRRRPGRPVRAARGARRGSCTWSSSTARSRPACATSWRRSPTPSCTSATRWTIDLATLAPPPGQDRRQPSVRDRRDRDPAHDRRAAERLGRWVVMVQREVGERFAAAPGSAAYGVPSVLAQLACEVKVLRPVARTVFRPVPNVDSVLLGLRRAGPAADRGSEHARPRGVRAPSQGARRLAGAAPATGRRRDGRPGGAGRARSPGRRARRAAVAARSSRGAAHGGSA